MSPAPLQPAYAAPPELGPRFQILLPLGKGGMAKVWAARDHELDCDVALKILDPSLVRSSAFARFCREVVLTRRITHPNVVKLFDILNLNGHSVMTMELVDGGSLKDWIRQEGALELDVAIHLLWEVALGLDAAHQLKILHRDIKPHNVLLSADRRHAKLADFGLSYSLIDSGTPITSKGVILGTPTYMAPEFFQADLYDLRSDLYSFGAMAYEVVTGAPPFRAIDAFELCQQHCLEPPVPPRERRPELPEELSRIILRCLAKPREDRFQTTAELLDALALLEARSKSLKPVEASSPAPSIAPFHLGALCPSCKEFIAAPLAQCFFCTPPPFQCGDPELTPFLNLLESPDLRQTIVHFLASISALESFLPPQELSKTKPWLQGGLQLAATLQKLRLRHASPAPLVGGEEEQILFLKLLRLRAHVDSLRARLELERLRNP